MTNRVLGFNLSPATRHRTVGLIAVILISIAALSGCQAADPTAHIIFLDGASHFGSATKVRSGLRRAGYRGEFEGFVWTSFLGWGVDHLVRANSESVAIKLANRIREVRTEHPDGYLALMGLSAGSAVILGALERLPEGQTVDDVVLFQPSVASDRELTRALEHVRRRMIATHCRWDAILAAMAISADQHIAKPAGQIGFQSPRPMSAKQRRQYIKLLSIPWQKRYAASGWGGIKGWHVSSTSPGFVRRYIAPYVLTSVRHAKSRAMRDRLDAREAEWQSTDETYQRQKDWTPPDAEGYEREPIDASPEADRRGPQPSDIPTTSNPTVPADTPDRDEPAREPPPTRPES